ncbi:hypothetical protein [Miltoncostaea oceani]|jgi:hypothetical protein|uniref:hypothetical protein n=1 Tax=Miltoncostaea oceani TaxID=2843216 RepID=UPI001C3CB868|nr:hypothetical protein [Miltoncostaea oceani]
MRTVSVVVLLVMAGCGNLAEPPERVGRLGAALDDSGRLEVLVAACREGVVMVSIAEGRTADMSDDEQNARVGAWTAVGDEAPRTLRPADPGAEWRGDAAAGPTGDTVWIIDGTLQGQDGTALHGPAVSADDLAALGPDRVMVHGEPGVSVPRTGFDGDCS